MAKFTVDYYFLYLCIL